MIETPPAPTTPVLTRHRTSALVVAWGLVLGAAAIWITRSGLIDDSYITLSYARNLAEHGHWGLTPGEVSNSATSPGNILVLAAAMRILLLTGSAHPVIALGLVTMIAAALAGLFAARSAARLGLNAWWAIATITVTVLNPFVLSALGLEVVLIITCVLGLLSAALASTPKLFGVIAAAALLVRLDLIVFVVVLALFTPGIRRRLHVAIGVAALCALPWFAISWIFLGSAIPDTFIIKTAQHSFGDHTYLNGLWRHYWPMNRDATVVMIFSGVIGVLVWLGLLISLAVRRTPVPGRGALLALGLGGIGYSGVYSVLGVPPYQWYYVAPVAALSIVAILGLGLALRRIRLASLLVAIALVPLALVALVISAPGHRLPWATPPIFGNFATAAQYQDIGTQVGEIVGKDRVGSPGEIGTLAFSCDCEIIDAFSDRAMVSGLIQTRIDDSGPLMSAALRANYARLPDVRAQPVQHQMLWFPVGAEITTDLVREGTWAVTGGGWVGPGTLILVKVA